MRQDADIYVAVLARVASGRGAEQPNFRGTIAQGIKDDAASLLDRSSANRVQTRSEVGVGRHCKQSQISGFGSIPPPCPRPNIQCPQGIIGTVEIAFCGEPSISLSLIAT